ncbi:VID27-like protein [Stylophora pistillata]|uniref:VID27-like protein n=1 Tax=Stylophora pistillata TaxID=50429 RepID=UPI000C042569|nr:VID27-like protein [Stylophora pistillata]
MEQDGAWGDHVILCAAANCYKTCIRVVSSLNATHDVILRPQCPVYNGRTLVLGHIHEVHYVSLHSTHGQIHRDADGDDSDDESKDQSAHEQGAHQPDYEEPEERDETEQDEEPEEEHEDPSEQREEPEIHEKESEEKHEAVMEDEPDKQEKETENDCKESEEQDEDNIDEEAGEDEEFIKSKDNHQADDNLPAASGRESPRAPLATFDDDSDLDQFYEALDGIKETSV